MADILKILIHVNGRLFTKMPSEHYMIEAKLLLGCASDDVPRADEIRTIIKDIWDIRMSKIRSSVNKLIKDAESYADVTNLTILEINSIKPIFPHVLDQIHRIKATRKPPGTQSQNTTILSTSAPSTSFPISK
ncbi:DNA replication complex GINS protein PSF2-like protein isoform X2 [Leptinotarsa decemlineata]|uniref:DNA replication complex GINS protein PSF2-like protein isoform X2 n=1 Tax=Leptinotarsa decemlineata TaxID=7539 RepID=UPI000C253D87|nr:probable DNA replication complex GINS protein PSF2 isoform X2 [Leptinotarsa decemlineata]